jgi:hypothetical protein
MLKKQKRILLFSVILIVVILGVAFSARYIPFNRLLKVSGTTETAFINPQHITPDVPHTLYFDFEVGPKNGNTGDLYKGIAHSGHYSTKAFGKNSYSFSVERKAGDIGLENLGAVGMSAWVYIFPGKNDPLGNFVFAASNGSINVVWKAITVSGNYVPRGKWFKISGMFDLSDVKFKPDYKLVFYFWNNSSTDILIDDFYIVFGGPKPRRGDSTLVDLSRGASFTQKFNFPPYPFHFFGKEEINNENSSFLIKNGKMKEDNISPYDRIFSGHFISDNRGTEDLLVINKDGKAELFTFCRDDREFRKITPVIPPDIQSNFFHSADIISGCFSGGGTTQLLLSGPEGVLVGEFEKIRDACSGTVVQASFKPILKTKINPFPAGTTNLITADLEGNKITEILATAADGSWKVFRFEREGKKSLSVLASGDCDPLKQWNSRQNNLKITPGRFLQKYPQDLLLTVSGEKSKTGYSWSLLRFDPVSRSFIPCFNEKQNHLGKTIGLDTLKPSDEFLTSTFDNSGKVNVFRYNHDWRYDLKEIWFNDSTFQVIANMDFTGYEKDFNPKYFEILRLFPAMLVDPGLTSFLVIGKNCKKKDPKEKGCREFIDLPALPGTIQVVTFQNTEK